MFGYEFDYLIRIFRELNNGNTGRTKHWSQAHSERRAWRKSLNNALIILADGTELAFYDHVKDPPSYMQGLVVRRVLRAKQAKYDCDSILRGNAKECIDSLIEAGVAKDDNTKYIAWVFGTQCAERRTIGPFTEVEVWKHG